MITKSMIQKLFKKQYLFNNHHNLMKIMLIFKFKFIKFFKKNTYKKTEDVIKSFLNSNDGKKNTEQIVSFYKL